MRMPTLHQFFRHQLSVGFAAHGLGEPATVDYATVDYATVDYVSEVLARFAHTRTLYAVTDTHGRPLEYVVDYLVEERGDGERRSDRARSRSLLRHLGEYTLFMSGLFRDRLKTRGELNYYMAQGANAYLRCADFEPQPVRRQLFRRLHDNFIRIADTLDDMRRTRFPLPVTPAGSVINADSMMAALWRR